MMGPKQLSRELFQFRFSELATKAYFRTEPKAARTKGEKVGPGGQSRTDRHGHRGHRRKRKSETIWGQLNGSRHPPVKEPLVMSTTLPAVPGTPRPSQSSSPQKPTPHALSSRHVRK